jgi:hypothetical protein
MSEGSFLKAADVPMSVSLVQKRLKAARARLAGARARVNVLAGSLELFDSKRADADADADADANASKAQLCSASTTGFFTSARCAEKRFERAKALFERSECALASARVRLLSAKARFECAKNRDTSASECPAYIAAVRAVDARWKRAKMTFEAEKQRLASASVA